MRPIFAILLVITASLASTTSVSALEKTAARMVGEDRPRDWSAGSTCSVRYWNTCTGWVWVWSGWNPNEMFGVVHESCCPDGGVLLQTNLFVWTAAGQVGWGFTGVLSVSNADEDGCPSGPPLASQTFFPDTGWNQYEWGTSVGPRFVVHATLGPAWLNALSIPSDHPAAGSTGPIACGLCFSSDRPAHSFRYGTSDSPLCPGSSLDDGTCSAEFLADAVLSCATPVEPTSWGSLKNLYR